MTLESSTTAGESPRIAGYRILRTLGEGERATVLLGHAGEATNPRRAALKVFRSGVTIDSIDRELQALERAQHAHIVALRDLATLGDGRTCAVLEPLTRGSLARLLASGRVLAAGEAVTVLAPIAAAVSAMHLSGVCHGAIGAGTVLFRDSGAPVLAAFGRALLIEQHAPPIVRAASEALLADASALAALAAAVLRAVGTASLDVARWVEEERRHGATEAFPAQLESRIFELGAAQAVRWGDASGRMTARVPARLGLTAHPAPAIESHDEGVDASHGARATEARATGGGAGQPRRERILAAARSRWQQLISAPGFVRVRERLPVRRRALVVAGTVGVVVFLGALAVVPRAELPRGDSGSAVAPIESPRPASSAASPASAAVHGDDPVAAFRELVDVRTTCIEQLSVLCLDAVDQSGSAALDDDVALIRAIENGAGPQGDPAIVVDQLREVERYGDVALVQWGGPDSETASALLVKGEAGWRVRDYLAS